MSILARAGSLFRLRWSGRRAAAAAGSDIASACSRSLRAPALSRTGDDPRARKIASVADVQ
jgi:hypothetical protein